MSRLSFKTYCIELFAERKSIPGNEALKLFYESHIGACYCDDSTGLYGQSANYIFSLLRDEISAG